ncbi:glutamine synthetase [Oscillospiraceae bacterium]|nr:glutamine synthetase [Oscillospiraceae bacterium]
MSKVPELFGSMVFSGSVMRDRLPQAAWRSLQKTIQEGTPLDPAVADAVAAAMKDWAVSKGATHFTHWFQPMTGVTAEKHDSFLHPVAGGGVLMEFSGKELVKGEPDASSFPSGGLRATFEARGYTAWDPTSYAFIKDETLCIPTAFCSYTGEVLDKKTPLLRSMDALSRQACRILALLGSPAKRVNAAVGPEQEYFLINKADYARRPDLLLTGRTLLGAPAPKGQELEDHYFGSIRPRVKAFMADLDEELWKLGICAKTEHNEVAPAQHEMAPIFATANIATDANQLAMEVMKKVADRHGFACLLHEKPFAGVNGSGKHNNWSLCTDTGENLLEPGTTPAENTQFLLFLTAVIKAVDDYQDLLRISVASAGNDHRLGANEAPPAIVSIFVGDELQGVVDALVSGRPFAGAAQPDLDTGAVVLPNIPKDNSDRNRTSPFAFTGNKFEFRMPGSSFNIACTNLMLNTAVAEALRLFADELESAPNPERGMADLIRRELAAHRRILFNGNGYSAEWEAEAARRGLANYRTTPEALAHYTDEKNVRLFAQHGVLTLSEMRSRQQICLDEYAKAVRIEALTLLDLVHRWVAPACIGYSRELAEGVAAKKALGIEAEEEQELAALITAHTGALLAAARGLAQTVQALPGGPAAAAPRCAGEVLPAMAAVRAQADCLEGMVSKERWPLPGYTDLLFYA